METGNEVKQAGQAIDARGREGAASKQTDMEQDSHLASAKTIAQLAVELAGLWIRLPVNADDTSSVLQHNDCCRAHNTLADTLDMLRSLEYVEDSSALSTGLMHNDQCHHGRASGDKQTC